MTTPDPTLKATWKAYEAELRARLHADDIASAIAIVEATRADLWLGIQDCDFVAYAVVALVKAGRDDDALALLEQAKRYGFPRFWYFSPTSTALSPELRAILEPVHTRPALADFVRARFSPVVTPWGFDLTWTPLCWGEQALSTRKNAKCELTGKRITKGEPVYALRYFNGAFDIPTDLAVVLPSALADNPKTRANRMAFEADSYELESFAFKVGYSHPRVNAFWHDRSRFDLRATIAMIADPMPAPAQASPESVFAGANGELVDLLWVLVKCGHLPAIVTMLPELPRHFPLLLALFARAPIRAAVADYLGMPELPRIYNLIGTGRRSAKTRAELAAFGAAHPDFQALLATSLRLYEYHRYDNYQCSPNWFFQDFRYLVRGGGEDLLHLLAPGA